MMCKVVVLLINPIQTKEGGGDLRTFLAKKENNFKTVQAKTT